MRSSVLENSLMSLEIGTYKDSSSISTASIEYSPQSEESELQQDIMSESYDPGEGPSSGNLQDKCSICDFATHDRQEIIHHLTEHIMSRTNSSLEVINMALNQLRHFHNQERHSTPLRNDSQDDDKCAEEPGVLVPRMNSQGKVKTFPCKNCDFKAVTKLEYWRHIRIHIKPSKLMCCYKCPFVTEYKHHLEYHLLNHTGAKPYKCSMCSYTCVNKSMLNSHMKSHSSVYQYRCMDCEYATKYCHTLKQHLRKYNHQPAAVLNVDGTLSPMVIDVYGTRRGPKQRPKNSDNKTSTATATATATDELSTSTATQTMASGEGNSSNSNDNVQPSTSLSPQTSPQALPSMSSRSALVPTSFTLGVSMLANIFNGRKGNNLVLQKNEQTSQERVHFPFRSHICTLNMETQQLLPNGGFGFDEISQMTAPSDEAERQSSEGAEEEMATPATSTAKVGEYKTLEGSTIENTIMPLDLTSGSSLRNEVAASKLPYQQLPLNLASSPKVGTRRRKGVAIKLEHRIVEKEEDTDEEMMQNEKRLCQSISPQAASAPSISLVASPTPSTSPQAASIPSISFVATPTSLTSVIAASTAPSSSPGKDSAGDSACPGQKYEETSMQSESPGSQDRFVCSYCDIPFPDQTVYIAHARYHSIAEPFTCNMCGTSYGNMQKFNLHIFEKKCLKQHEIASSSCHCTVERLALDLQDANERIHLMATFLPDEILRGIVLSQKSSRSFRAVLLLLNTSGFSALFTRYIHDENVGSLRFTTILNDYIGAVAREVYRSEGDILKLSAGGLLAAWKVGDDQFTFDTVQKVIECAIRIRDSNQDGRVPRTNITISAGEVTLSVIGNDEARDFVVHGAAISDLWHAGKASRSNDLVLSFSAWRHCTPSQYEYVVKDSRNVKIIKTLMQFDKKPTRISNADANSTSAARMSVTDRMNMRTIFTNEEFQFVSTAADSKERTSTTTPISAIATTNLHFKTLLKSHLMKSVVQQIERDQPLDFFAAIRHVTTVSLDIVPDKYTNDELIERDQPLDFFAAIRHVTTVSLDIVPDKYTNDELVLLIDKCFLLVHSVVTQYAGYIDAINLCEKSFLFRIVFGMADDQRRGIEVDEACRNGVTCAIQVLRTVKSIARIYNVSVGVSTGLAYCGVIGNVMRKHYAVIGPSVDRAAGIMNVSYDKVSCDYNTVLHSRLNKDQFRSRGLKTLGPSEKGQVYEYLDGAPQEDDPDKTSSAEYCYPILGRQQELDKFDDVLDEIGVAGRTYSGLLIEGGERSGKSRLLDAFVASVRNRQIRTIELSLHATYAEKTHAAVHHVILQILEAEDCDTIEERQKVLLAKLAGVITPEDLCYLNDLMRVHFSLSDTYCSDSSLRRHKKTVGIFETILKQLTTKICILLDDVQYMDNASWQFLSSALNHDHVVVAMTMLTTEPSVQHYTSRTQAVIRGDSRLMKQTLYGLDPHLLPALACQFLNVFAIPRKLSRTLLASTEGHIGWFEVYLMLLLQSDALDLIRISPSEASRRDLVFPDGRMITRLPVDLTPHELSPPRTWSQMSYLYVCDVNERYTDEISKMDRDTRGLMYKIYEGMTPFERSFIACAATLGTVFKRNVLLKAIPGVDDAANTAISMMFRTRILECASLQRRDFLSEDLVLCILKKRRTFSDMRHSVTCGCHFLRRTVVDTPSPLGAHCKTLEFKVDSFRKMVYDAQSDKDKRRYHAKAVEIYSRNARKCNSCGAGAFLRVPGEDISMRRKNDIQTARILLARRKMIFTDPWNRKKSFVAERSKFSAARRQESVNDTPRVSIMPTYLDHVDEDEGEVNKIINFLMEYSSGLIQIAQPSHAIKLLVIAAEKNERTARVNDNAEESVMNRGIILALIVRFSLANGIGVPGHFKEEEVLKILENLFVGYKVYFCEINFIFCKRIFKYFSLCQYLSHSLSRSSGDAHSALGNYAQAYRSYEAAVTLQGAPLKIHKVVCCGPLMTMKIHREFYDLSNDMTNEKSARQATKRLELASYTRRLCLALAREGRMKAAKLFALQSFKASFPSFDGFLEKGETYLAAVRVTCRTDNNKFTRYIEKPMLTVIETKFGWNNVEEIAMLAKIYFAMYQVRALKGELEDAVDMGVKVLRISRTLHLNDLSLVIMPSLIEIMLWTKRINQAVDLMAELYFIAEEDVDLSAKTWYYALSLELLVDAGVLLESYETSLNYYEKFIAYRSKSYVTRDPQSCRRLVTCLWIYQLRMGHTLTDTTVCNVDEYVEGVDRDRDFTRVFTCCKVREIKDVSSLVLRHMRLKNKKGS
ncbi:uncharacterized protein LOC116849520 [Odontomachus brunneus]|uniref:uncharacterized protein LOC116849520 n=1 Tax=Odontomachus brunneus TaxID=486640 RepID=UPI0013F1BAE7|nr:uncharacterized protein LOC116849520 [Odontomachus brunneus]